MTNFIPIYPFDTIIYPGELLHIEIAEAKYVQLIKDCFIEQKQLGIRPIINSKAMEYGTLVQVDSVVTHADSNILSVDLKGLQVFRILEVIKDIPEKPYKGAIVNYPENEQMKVHPNLSKLIFDEAKTLFKKLQIENQLPSEIPEWKSYDFAHKFGLAKEQEYELLTIFNEVQRMEYLRRFFNSIMPELDDIELIKSRINLN